jgi:multisubunit Na+/H+ antiporter MnhC subunit
MTCACYMYCLIDALTVAGVYTCLTPIVLVDLLGLGKLSNAFGLVLLFQGIGAVVGPPIAGK